MQGIDVSSAQGLRIGPLIGAYGAEHVVVKLPSRYERAGLDVFSIAQIQATLDAGKTCSNYGWLWRDFSARETALSQLDVADRAGHIPKVMHADLEIYEYPGHPQFDPGPRIEQILEWGDTVQSQAGCQLVAYTGRWWVDGYLPGGRAAFSQLSAAGWGLWLALYDWVADLDVWPRFGGFTDLIGKQYRADGIDRDVFDSAVAA